MGFGLDDIFDPIGSVFKDVGSGLGDAAKGIGQGLGSVISPITSTIGGLGNNAENLLGKGLDIGGNFLEAPLKLFSNPFVIIGVGIVAIVVIPPLLKK